MGNSMSATEEIDEGVSVQNIEALKTMAEITKNVPRKQTVDPIITFDIRGTFIKTYTSTIEKSKSRFFKDLLHDDFKSSVQSDGSYFIDCDPRIFIFMLEYIKTGVLPYAKYRRNYVETIFTEFGVSVEDLYETKKDVKKKMHDEIERIYEEDLDKTETLKIQFVVGKGNPIYNESVLTIPISQDEFNDYIEGCTLSVNMRNKFFKTDKTCLEVKYLPNESCTTFRVKY